MGTRTLTLAVAFCLSLAPAAARAATGARKPTPTPTPTATQAPAPAPVAPEPAAPIDVPLAAGANAPAKSAGRRIDVRLFGQPCHLLGPETLSIEALRAIHAISPEQLPFPDHAQGAAAGIAAVTKAAPTPAELEEYRVAARRWLSAHAELFQAMTRAAPLPATGRAPLLRDVFLQHRRPGTPPEPFQTAAAKWATTPTTATVETVVQTFREAIEPDPQALFHRATRKLGVEYVCDFDPGVEE